MSSVGDARTVRRIAVAADAGEQSLRLIGLAAGIAALLKAELEGVFIEDAELLRAVGLPFQREFRLTTRAEEAVDAKRLERELRAASRRVQAILAQAAERLGCPWSFRIWRGDLEAEILSAASTAEMFTLAPLGRFAPLRMRPTPAPPAQRPLVIGVLFDGSAGALRALTAARELAGQDGNLQVYLQLPGGADPEALREQARSALGGAAERARLLPLAGGDPPGIVATVVAGGGDLLMIDGGNPLTARETLWRSLAALRCPMLVVR
jgi:hypothetical protein